MSWSQQTQKKFDSYYQAIIKHPFLKQLAAGTLSKDCFHFYLAQDSIYLFHYRKIMTLIAAKCDDSAMQSQFLQFALSTIVAEIEVQQSLLDKVAIKQLQPTPSCLLYTGYLYQQLATQPLPVIIATILPCFWLYQKIGEALPIAAEQHDHPYYTWITTYQTAEYKRAVDQVIRMVDTLAQQSNEAVREAMSTAFGYASKLEWQFWQSAWCFETWPI